MNNTREKMEGKNDEQVSLQVWKHQKTWHCVITAGDRRNSDVEKKIKPWLKMLQFSKQYKQRDSKL